MRQSIESDPNVTNNTPSRYLDPYGQIFVTPEDLDRFANLWDEAINIFGENGDPRPWGKRPQRVPGNKYSCRAVMYIPPPLQCPAPKCPLFTWGEGIDKNLSKAKRKAKKQASDRVPKTCGHQHHMAVYCRKGNGKPWKASQ